jgi:hypothetical protein
MNHRRATTLLLAQTSCYRRKHPVTDANILLPTQTSCCRRNHPIADATGIIGTTGIIGATASRRVRHRDAICPD